MRDFASVVLRVRGRWVTATVAKYRWASTTAVIEMVANTIVRMPV
jgi:hypothetical protein